MIRRLFRRRRYATGGMRALALHILWTTASTGRRLG